MAETPEIARTRIIVGEIVQAWASVITQICVDKRLFIKDLIVLNCKICNYSLHKYTKAQLQIGELDRKEICDN